MSQMYVYDILMKSMFYKKYVSNYVCFIFCMKIRQRKKSLTLKALVVLVKSSVLNLVSGTILPLSDRLSKSIY